MKEKWLFKQKKLVFTLSYKLEYLSCLPVGTYQKDFVTLSSSRLNAVDKGSDGITFFCSCYEDRSYSLGWNNCVCFYERFGFLWQSSHMLRRVQKPQTPYASQHVRNCIGCQRHSIVYLLFAFHSCNSISWPVGAWRNFL